MLQGEHEVQSLKWGTKILTVGKRPGEGDPLWERINYRPNATSVEVQEKQVSFNSTAQLSKTQRRAGPSHIMDRIFKITRLIGYEWTDQNRQTQGG